MKRTFIGVVILMMILSLSVMGTACKESGTAEEAETVEEADTVVEAEAAKEDITIGFSFYDFKISYFVLMDAGAKDYCEERGWDYISHDEKSDETTMVTGCQDLINQGIDALCVSPFKPEALGPVVEAAHAKDIPVIISDIGTGDYDYDAFIVSDNIGGGKLAAEYLIDYFNEKGITGDVEVGVMRIDPSNVANHSRGDGFIEVVEAEGYTVVKDMIIQEATADSAYPVAKDVITANPDIQAIFCTNDNMATGAAQAAIDSGKPNIAIIGFDGQEVALQSIENGTMLATVMQYPYKFGQIACELAGVFIAGETPEYDIPESKTVFVPIEMIDQSNVDEAWEEVNKAK